MRRRRVGPLNLTPWGSVNPSRTVRPCDGLVYTRQWGNVPMREYRAEIRRDMHQYDNLPAKWRRDFREGKFDK